MCPCWRKCVTLGKGFQVSEAWVSSLPAACQSGWRTPGPLSAPWLPAHCHGSCHDCKQPQWNVFFSESCHGHGPNWESRFMCVPYSRLSSISADFSSCPHGAGRSSWSCSPPVVGRGPWKRLCSVAWQFWQALSNCPSRRCLLPIRRLIAYEGTSRIPAETRSRPNVQNEQRPLFPWPTNFDTMACQQTGLGWEDKESSFGNKCCYFSYTICNLLSTLPLLLPLPLTTTFCTPGKCSCCHGWTASNPTPVCHCLLLMWVHAFTLSKRLHLHFKFFFFPGSVQSCWRQIKPGVCTCVQCGWETVIPSTLIWSFHIVYTWPEMPQCTP
jgi:hypothetical protein